MSSFKIPNIFPNLDQESKTTLNIVGCFAMAGLLVLSIWGKAGSFGAIVGAFVQNLLGKGAFLLPVSFVVAGLVLIKLQKEEDLKEDFSIRLAWGLGFLMISFEGFLNLFMGVDSVDKSPKAGGLLGFLVYPMIFGSIFGKFGAFLLLSCIFLIGFFMVSQMTFVQFIAKIKESFSNPKKFLDLIPDGLEFWKKGGLTQEELLEKDGQGRVKDGGEFSEFSLVGKTGKPEQNLSEEEKVIFKTEAKTGADGVVELTPVKKTYRTAWKLPPFDILKESKTLVDPGDVEKNKELIGKTLAHFGIKVDMESAVVGPTVTQYRLKPANGVRLSTIDKLQRDIGLALATPNIRIEAPISGLSLVGIEVPNRTKSEVRIRDIIQTTQFVHSHHLTVAVGKDVAGKNILYPISKMPHLLVAGATGSGKSVWINSMLLSLLYRYNPKDLHLILVDMKRVELKLYDNIPHLLCKVITDAEKAINALKWTVIEMDKRYKILEECGKRNIQDYNEFVQTVNSNPGEKDPNFSFTKMPYIVFVIDELGDLMMLAKSEVEPIIVRITQMARAVGIHLVLGTQRPDTGVITGLIKANIPTRIAFAVASQIDSRVILDTVGAEKLIGQGDGLMLSPTSLHPIRFQGSFVEEDEVKKCVDFLKEQMETRQMESNEKKEVVENPKVKINVPGLENHKSQEDGDEEQDSLFLEAKKMVVRHQKASASFLQQVMGIGYPKAAKYIMRMEEIGLVGPQNGSKPREVYPENFEG